MGFPLNEAILDEVTGEPIGYNITPHLVGSWIEPSQMQKVSEKLSEAIVATLPAADKKKAMKELEKLNIADVSEKNV